MRWWCGTAVLAGLAFLGFHSAALSEAGTGAYYLGCAIGGLAILLIFVFIGQRGRDMPDRFFPDIDVRRLRSLVVLLCAFAGLAGLGIWLAFGPSDRDLHLAGLLLAAGAVVGAVRAVARYYDRSPRNALSG